MSRLAFVVGGAQKSGTTTLDAILRRHPQIQMARVKETHFFDDEERDWKSRDYSAFHSLFADCDNRLRGEATPITMYWRPAIRRLYDYNPDVRIVLILRDPATRALSHWRHEYSEGRENMSFREAIRGGRCRVRSQGTSEGLHRVVSYVERGLYGEQLHYLLKYFPKSQVHCEIREEFFQDQPAGLARLAGFLGIDPFPAETPDIHLNRAHDLACAPTLTADDIFYLTSIFCPQIELVENFLGRPIPHWRVRGAR